MASKDQIKTLITTALANEYWQLAMYCAAVAIGTGCRGGEIRNLQLKDIDLEESKVRIVIHSLAKQHRWKWLSWDQDSACSLVPKWHGSLLEIAFCMYANHAGAKDLG